MIVKDGAAKEKDVHPSMLNKIKRLRKMLDENGGTEIEIAVDGSIDYSDIKGMLDAGANILVLLVVICRYSASVGISKPFGMYE